MRKSGRLHYEGSVYKITSISNAFYNEDNIYSIIIPNTVTRLEAESFQSCDHLGWISIPDSVTFIGKDAFYYCGLKNIYFGGTKAQWNTINPNNRAAVADTQYGSPDVTVHCSDGDIFVKGH